MVLLKPLYNIFIYYSPSLRQWVYILDVVHRIMSWCSLSSVDPALTAEVILRLSYVFEASASLESSETADPARSKTNG